MGDEHKRFLDPAQANLYALAHASGIYENQRRDAPEKRVLNYGDLGILTWLEIPDEELKALADEGFTGLWLIGIEAPERM